MNRDKKSTMLSTLTSHPGALGSFRRILQLCAQGGVEHVYLPRLLALSMTSLSSSPLRLCEDVVYYRHIRHAAIPPSPIFILGHWRSGTTHLQNLMCQDKSFGYLSAFQAIAPGFSLIGGRGLRYVLKRAIEPMNRTRPMDRVAFSLDAPQEEELALANITSRAFYHAFALPRQAQTFFQRYVMIENLPPSARARWINTYLKLLHKIALANSGKRLLLKNCAHTARIPMLLDLFPDAKFIYIHRNPYDVFLSTLHLHQRLISICQLQSIEQEQIEENVLSFYWQLLHKYLQGRSLVPAGNLVEVTYEDLEKEPLQQVQTIYSRLRLPGFDAVESSLGTYIKSLHDYKKNKYALEPDVVATVNRSWQFAFEEWGYDRL